MKRIIAVGLVLMLVLITVPIASAQDITYWSGIQIQNQSDQEASVTITFYKQDGSVEAEYTDVTIPANDSKTYGTLDDLVSDGFTGSAVISSDQPVVAIVNTMGNGTDFGASSDSFSEGASEVRLPLIMKGNYGYSTWYNVQNVGSEDAVVSVTYSDGSTEADVTIPPGAAHTYDQAGLPDGFVGSATVTSTGGEIVATVVEVGPTTLFAYNGFVGGVTTPSMPLVQQNNYDYVTGIQIMNVGTLSTTVTVDYTAGAEGSDNTETKDISPGASATFDMAVDGTPYLGGTETFVGSAAVVSNTASQDLVVVVNQLNSGANKGAAYGGFDPDSATETVNLPLIMDRNYDYFTGFSIVNAGDTATDVTFTCTGEDGAAYATSLGTINLPAGGATAPVQLDSVADGYVGACTATAASGGKILGIVNELNAVATGDAFLVYEGFNK